MPIEIRRATEADSGAIAAIYNQGIEDRGATFETEFRTAAEMSARTADGARFPMLVALDGKTVLAWAGLSGYRARACYSGIAEFSIYVERDARGRGIGRELLMSLVDAARDAGYWKLVSRIFPFNAGSRAVCKACGFREVGTYEKHGCLDGTWLDVVIVERLIPENLTRSAASEPGSPPQDA